MNKKMPLYEFSVCWQHLAGEDPEHRMYKTVSARSVPNALTRFYKAMAQEYGKSRNGFLVLDVSNMSIP